MKGKYRSQLLDGRIKKIYIRNVLGKLKSPKILHISDMHLPYEHKDMLKFLAAVKKKYKPDIIIQSGDFVDNHAISFHDKHPDNPNPGRELDMAIAKIKQVAKLFPKMYITVGNHDALPYRKVQKEGISSRMMKSYRDMYEAPDGWEFYDEVRLVMKNRGAKYYALPDVSFRHDFKSTLYKGPSNEWMCCVQGDAHSRFGTVFGANPHAIHYHVYSGWLGQPGHPAFDYTKKFRQTKFFLGVSIIEHPFPIQVPMVLDSRGRWNGMLPR